MSGVVPGGRRRSGAERGGGKGEEGRERGREEDGLSHHQVCRACELNGPTQAMLLIPSRAYQLQSRETGGCLGLD
jgi:hypothetical protein